MERTSPTTMKVSVSADELSYLFTSIPEEKGWEVFVDGKKTDYEICLGALLSVPIEPGKHTVEFRFTTAGYPLAVIVSLAGLALFIGMIFIKRKFFRLSGDDEKLFNELGGGDGSKTDEESSEAPSDVSGSGEDDDESGEGGEDDDELLDIFRPKGSGSEWMI